MATDFVSVYTDGGVIGKNPSSAGGTWAWVWVDHRGNEVARDSGIVTPLQAGLPAITNNYTELLAVLEGMRQLAPGWRGTLYTDSFVTQCRLLNRKASFKGIPDDLRQRVHRTQFFHRDINCILISGHPTKAQLKEGRGKGGRLVSRWNVQCDEECNRLSREFRRKLLPA